MTKGKIVSTEKIIQSSFKDVVVGSVFKMLTTKPIRGEMVAEQDNMGGEGVPLVLNG